MPLLADAVLIEKALTIAPELIPQFAQILADLNKLMADVEVALAADASAFKTPPTPVTPPPAA